MKLELTKPEPTKPEPNYKLRKARKARGWTQAMLAEKTNVGLSTVRSWEDGTRGPGVVHLFRLSEVFGMSSEELGFESDQTDEQPDLYKPDEIAPTLQRKQEASVTTFSNATTDSLGEKTDTHPVVDKNRHRMIQRVSSRWITDMLDQISPLISLNLRLTPERVSAPWKTRNQDLYVSALRDFSSTSIEQIFDHADGELLILGEPGSGKTVLLLELTQTLLARCRQDATLPIPVILHLASWTEKKPKLDDWLVEELKLKYQVPFRQAQAWIDNDQILPLLDGLDEVEISARSACVSAINAYRQEHGFLNLVVCCRSSDYNALPNRLVLGMATVIQPLTMQQIDNYVKGGKDLAAMQTALENDPALLDLASTPLMLNILAYSCLQNAQGMLSQEELMALQSSRDVMLEQYVERLLLKEIKKPSYTNAQMKHWLTWLARQMKSHNQSEFYLERIQPSWVEGQQRRLMYQRTVIRLVIGLQCLVSGILVAWLKGGLKNGVVGSGNGILGLFGGGTGNSALGWMAPGIGGGTQGGASLIIILGIVIWLITVIVGSPTVPTFTPRAIWHGLVHGLRAGLLLGAIAGIVSMGLFSLRGGITYGIIYGLGIGFFLAMLVGLMRGFLLGLRYGQAPPPKTRWTTRLLDGAIWGICGALGFIVVEELLRVNQISTLIYGSVVFLFFCGAYGFGGGSHLFSALSQENIQPVEIVTWDWSQMFSNVQQNLLKCLILALVITISVSLAIAGVASLFFLNVSYGVHYGLVFGIITGLIVSIVSLLATLLKSGWSGSLLPEDQYTRPNEGIERSGRNALLGACLVAPLGGVASGLACAVGFGLVGALPTWPVLAMAFALMLTIIIFVIFVTAHGGIAVASHYTLRWYLKKSSAMPVNYVCFLNGACEYALLRKVGGGYIFTHRLVLEHFARLQPSKRLHN